MRNRLDELERIKCEINSIRKESKTAYKCLIPCKAYREESREGSVYRIPWVQTHTIIINLNNSIKIKYVYQGEIFIEYGEHEYRIALADFKYCFKEIPCP